MSLTIALAGNPNCGKTTLFNVLTGSNQFVGNWPGVTVEKKEGRLKNSDDVIITDLPGIYSLSPYTLEEVVARNYLVEERPDAILNVVDGTNIERNLYLTTQLAELGIPVVVAINMMDMVRKNGDKINIEDLSRQLGCKVIEISALKETGIDEAINAATQAAKNGVTVPMHIFSGTVEHAIAHIEEAAVHSMPEEQQRWYAVKLFERDVRVVEKLGLSDTLTEHIESDIQKVEKELDDDAESIITNERYIYIGEILRSCYKRKSAGELSVSDKIDRVVTNRFAALPIFAVIMFLVYYISMVTVGSAATDWTNDGVFGEGWHLFGIGSYEAQQAAEEFGSSPDIINAFIRQKESQGVDVTALRQALSTLEGGAPDIKAITTELEELALGVSDSDETSYIAVDEETQLETEVELTGADFHAAVEAFIKYGGVAPSPENYGVWVPGVPVLAENALDAVGCDTDWLRGLILDGIIAGVGAVLGFVPQMFVLFLMLAILEACGYMSRIAFVLDRIFRKFGLSGKSFIPILVGTGCSVPGIMASRTIENESDRRMTVITTSFIPCGAKQPLIALMAGAVFGGSPWIATGAYFIGMAAIIVSGIILKKFRMFCGEPSPFVMELPAYHFPTPKNVLRSMWDRGWSFVKKAGTVILLFSVVIWFTSFFGRDDTGVFRMLSENEMQYSILAKIGEAVCFIFAPLGWGDWRAAVATITGLAAKENIVASLGILYGGGEATVYAALGDAFTSVTAMSFLIFNLLCAPCFAAMGAIKREMNSAKWFWFAIGYECLLAYAVSFVVNQIGGAFTGSLNLVGLVTAILTVLAAVYLLIRPVKKKTQA